LFRDFDSATAQFDIKTFYYPGLPPSIGLY